MGAGRQNLYCEYIDQKYNALTLAWEVFVDIDGTIDQDRQCFLDIFSVC